MSFEITCPYCFRKMQDTEVLFRSEKVNQGECGLLPDEYDGIEDFKVRYDGPDKESILRGYQEWEFFAAGPDPVYEEFWAEFNGTTEYNPTDEVMPPYVKSYYRKVIDPSLPEHRRYLKPQGPGDFFIRDQGMVSGIELASGNVTGKNICNRRVCPHCHNPLPDGYGRNPVKFATVIGITGAGKTIYLSQLLKDMTLYVVKAGLSAMDSGPEVQTFLDRNIVAAGAPLPGSTPFSQLQQPLFYEMSRDDGNQGRVQETFVLYDVAGEVFMRGDAALIRKFAPYVKHADGLIILISPLQLRVVNSVMTEEEREKAKKEARPDTVFRTIHNIFAQENGNTRCKVPLAVCVSKADLPMMQRVFSRDLQDMLRKNVEGVRDACGFYLPLFNATEYNPIFNELFKFFQNNEIDLAQYIHTSYASYAYFAFTALGCSVEERKKIKDSEYERIKQQCKERDMDPPPQYVPVDDPKIKDVLCERTAEGKLYVRSFPGGTILPKRVEEPLLWLFSQLGYIASDVLIDDPTKPKITCPACGSFATEELPEDQREQVSGWWKFRKVEYFNRVCRECGHCWEQN